MIKSDFLSLVRTKLYENAADLWSDADIYKLADEELRSLPPKNIYKEEIWTINTVVDTDEYQLPTRTYKVEDVKIDEASPTTPANWVSQKGWSIYGGRLILDTPPDVVQPMRIFIRKMFTPLATIAAGDTIDMGDEQLEVAVLGTVLRCYSSLMGYFVDLKNWDYNAKPDGISMNQVQAWIRETKDDYMSAVKYTKKSPQPRYIDLTS